MNNKFESISLSDASAILNVPESVIVYHVENNPKLTENVDYKRVYKTRINLGRNAALAVVISLQITDYDAVFTLLSKFNASDCYKSAYNDLKSKLDDIVAANQLMTEALSDIKNAKVGKLVKNKNTFNRNNTRIAKPSNKRPELTEEQAARMAKVTKLVCNTVPGSYSDMKVKSRRASLLRHSYEQFTASSGYNLRAAKESYIYRYKLTNRNVNVINVIVDDKSTFEEWYKVLVNVANQFAEGEIK